MDERQRAVWGREVALAAAVAIVQVGGVALAARHQANHPSLPWWGAALLLVATAAVPLRLSHSVLAAWVAFAATLAYWSLDTPRGPVFLALIITFGNLLFAGHRPHAIAVAAAGLVSFSWFPSLVGDEDPPSVGSVLALAAWLVTLFSVAEVLRARRDRHRATTRAHAELLQRQIATERLRIARDLHDVVAHNMSLINLQAGVALHVAGDETPAEVRESLATIKSASKEALVELRSILGVLRHVDDVTIDAVATAANSRDAEPAPIRPAAPRLPTPGLDELDDLLAKARAAGIAVTAHLDVDGDVPRPVQVAAYRIVQESLTNVARHARPPAATVSVAVDDHELVVEVVNDGRSAPADVATAGGGNGIAGMRERAASVGGRLTAGPRLAGGFAVNARLPLAEAP
jgi:signal transduction histidine kinase